MKGSEPTSSKQTVWLFDGWAYKPDSGLLKKSNTETRLSTQLNQVLLMLIENAPSVVTRQQFLAGVWCDKYVNEAALSRTIAELRKILGDSASQAKYIKTIPKKGYQLTQTVQPLTERNSRVLKNFIWVFVVVMLLLTTFYLTQRDTVIKNLQEAVANANRVTAKPGMEQQSVLSEDGQWLSYVKNSSEGSQVIIEAIEDANQHQVVELVGYQLSSPVYIPEKELLMFIARGEVNCYLKSYHLVSQVFNDLGTCIFNTESRTLEWNDSMQRLYFSDAVKHVGQQLVAIHQLDIHSGTGIQLTAPTSTNQQDLSPRVSPNQKYLSFSRGNQSVRNLWLKDFKSGVEWPLTIGEHYTVSHDWYDDEHIVFDSDLSGSRQLWVLNINEKTPHLLGAYGAQHPSFDQSREVMTFQEVSYEANIWLFNINSQQFNRVVHSTKYDNYPVFANDGLGFLFSSNRQDQSAIWLYDFVGSEERLLLGIEGAKLTAPSWHSNGREILITINDQRGYGTLVLDLLSKETYELPFNQGHLASKEYQGLFYALAKSKELNNTILQLDGESVTVLPINSVSRFMILADGRLVYSKTDQDGLFIFDTETGQEQLIMSSVKMSGLNLWTAVNQAVYYDQAGDQAGIWRIDVNTAEKQFITAHRPYSVGNSLSVNQAEDQVLITRTDRAESDVLKTQIK